MLASFIPAQPAPHVLKRRLKNGIYSYVDGELYKRCARCREYWPADTEFFHVSSQQPDGLRTCCKDCAQIKQQIARQRARQSISKE